MKHIGKVQLTENTLKIGNYFRIEKLHFISIIGVQKVTYLHPGKHRLSIF